MKKLIVSALASCLILSTLSAQEGKEDTKSKVKYVTNINAALAWPPEVQARVSGIFKVPVLNFDNPFTRGNNITFKLGAKLSPVTLEGTFDAVWTPIAFLELYGGASVGSGWSIITKNKGIKDIHGLSFNTANTAGKTEIKPINFTRAFYSANLGGALQFDLGAIIQTDWTHIVFRTDQYFLYRGVTTTDSFTSWVFQNDSGENRNGWTYFGTYVLGYQMPLPLKLIALQVETKKTFFRVRPGMNESDWGENRLSVVFGPVLNFKATDIFTITLVAQFKTVHSYNSPDENIFYQYRTIDKSLADKVTFKRVAVIFDVTIPHN